MNYSLGWEACFSAITHCSLESSVAGHCGAAKGRMGACEGIRERQQRQSADSFCSETHTTPTALPGLSESLSEVRQPVFQKSNNEKIKSRGAVPPSALLINS